MSDKVAFLITLLTSSMCNAGCFRTVSACCGEHAQDPWQISLKSINREREREREREIKREGATYCFDKLSALHDEEYKADDIPFVWITLFITPLPKNTLAITSSFFTHCYTLCYGSRTWSTKEADLGKAARAFGTWAIKRAANGWIKWMKLPTNFCSNQASLQQISILISTESSETKMVEIFFHLLCQSLKDAQVPNQP